MGPACWLTHSMQIPCSSPDSVHEAVSWCRPSGVGRNTVPRNCAVLHSTRSSREDESLHKLLGVLGRSLLAGE